MDPDKAKEFARRSSILKPPKPKTTFSEPVITSEDNTEVIANRRVSFACHNYVKEFMLDEERTTLWNATYEEPLTNYDQSSSTQGSNLTDKHSSVESSNKSDNNIANNLNTTTFNLEISDNLDLTDIHTSIQKSEDTHCNQTCHDMEITKVCNTIPENTNTSTESNTMELTKFAVEKEAFEIFEDKSTDEMELTLKSSSTENPNKKNRDLTQINPNKSKFTTNQTDLNDLMVKKMKMSKVKINIVISEVVSHKSPLTIEKDNKKTDLNQTNVLSDSNSCETMDFTQHIPITCLKSIGITNSTMISPNNITHSDIMNISNLTPDEVTKKVKTDILKSSKDKMNITQQFSPILSQKPNNFQNMNLTTVNCNTAASSKKNISEVEIDMELTKNILDLKSNSNEFLKDSIAEKTICKDTLNDMEMTKQISAEKIAELIKSVDNKSIQDISIDKTEINIETADVGKAVLTNDDSNDMEITKHIFRKNISKTIKNVESAICNDMVITKQISREKIVELLKSVENKSIQDISIDKTEINIETADVGKAVLTNDDSNDMELTKHISRKEISKTIKTVESAISNDMEITKQISREKLFELIKTTDNQEAIQDISIDKTLVNIEKSLAIDEFDNMEFTKHIPVQTNIGNSEKSLVSNISLQKTLVSEEKDLVENEDMENIEQLLLEKENELCSLRNISFEDIISNNSILNEKGKSLENVNIKKNQTKKLDLTKNQSLTTVSNAKVNSTNGNDEMKFTKVISVENNNEMLNSIKNKSLNKDMSITQSINNERKSSTENMYGMSGGNLVETNIELTENQSTENISMLELSDGSVDDTQHLINVRLSNLRKSTPLSDFSRIIRGDLNVSISNKKLVKDFDSFSVFPDDNVKNKSVTSQKENNSEKTMVDVFKPTNFPVASFYEEMDASTIYVPKSRDVTSDIEDNTTSVISKLPVMANKTLPQLEMSCLNLQKSIVLTKDEVTKTICIDDVSILPVQLDEIVPDMSNDFSENDSCGDLNLMDIEDKSEITEDSGNKMHSKLSDITEITEEISEKCNVSKSLSEIGNISKKNKTRTLLIPRENVMSIHSESELNICKEKSVNTNKIFNKENEKISLLESVVQVEKRYNETDSDRNKRDKNSPIISISHKKQNDNISVANRIVNGSKIVLDQENLFSNNNLQNTTPLDYEEREIINIDDRNSSINSVHLSKVNISLFSDYSSPDQSREFINKSKEEQIVETIPIVVVKTSSISDKPVKNWSDFYEKYNDGLMKDERIALETDKEIRSFGLGKFLAEINEKLDQQDKSIVHLYIPELPVVERKEDRGFCDGFMVEKVVQPTIEEWIKEQSTFSLDKPTYWKLENLSKNNCLCIVNRYTMLTVNFQENTYKVLDISAENKFTDNQAPLTKYIMTLLMKKLQMSQINAAVGEDVTLRTLLEYVQFTAEYLHGLEKDFFNLLVFGKKCMNVIMEDDFTVTISLHNIKLLSTWKISINVMDINNLSESSIINISAILGTVPVDSIRNLARKCPRGIKFLESFVEEIYNFRNMKESR